MKKILTICAFVALALSFTGCMGSAYTISNNITETKVVLSENNFEVVDRVYGEVTAYYFFGFCAMNKKELRNNAIFEMSRNAKLKGSQALVNITVTRSAHMITPFYVEVTYSATANVIEFK